MGEGDHAGLRALPAVHELAAQLQSGGAAQPLAVAAAREAIAERRRLLQGGQAANGDLLPRARALLADLERGTLRPVLNATGVILHTNLGRAPLPAAAREALGRVAEGYCNLELDLDSGRRGSRQAHVEELLCELTGTEGALVVGNGAGAVLLAVAALAGRGRDVIVSRGQLVEIGGGFRIPEVVEQSGARLVEVGATNRTRRPDYERALERSEGTVGAILRVHQSNFRAVGFVEEVQIEDLVGLGVPVIDDIGSGVVGAVELAPLRQEADMRRSVAAGAALVCCSGDKLLGGPQAGIIVGQQQHVAAAAAHPLLRALRIDKLSLAALEATLRLYRDPERARREIPVLAMLDTPANDLAQRASALLTAIGPDHGTIVDAVAKVGGGALPLLELPGSAVALRSDDPDRLAAALRVGDPPVIGRVQDGQLLLDPRTLAPDELPAAAAAVRRALEAFAGSAGGGSSG